MAAFFLGIIIGWVAGTAFWKFLAPKWFKK